MIADNTRLQGNAAPETPGLTATADCGMEDNSRSFQLFSDQTPTTFTDRLEAAFDEPIEDLFTRLYVVKQMSVPDIRRWFEERFGSVVSERHFYRIMAERGVQLRGHAERKRLSWKQGKMDASMAKSRQTRKRTYLLGSKAEKAIRYLLREALLVLGVKWDVIIGDNLQHILGRYEVDIPVVVVDRSTGAACRFAVEVDNSFTHASPKLKKRDAAKDRALEQSGWRVFRLDGGVKEQDVFAEQVADLVLAIEAHAAEIFINHSFPTNPSQARRATHHLKCVQVEGL
ncbi:hypothetical protein PITCH_A230034 [uncultured Desulfobacterium sp.]|uniref:DUF559 domain-containing protein n=1 Tax=uncultured Desulfobacterium sp. TaxID=201089 RepID=A0A445MY03_9BACT|nr:hypothetical protein PITCH_A230034 [uncultured Desulfobacterium sp.]